MTLSIGSSPGVIQFPLPQAAPAPVHDTVQVPLPKAPAPASGVVIKPPASANDNSYARAIRQIESAYKDTYAVSDKSFTIFKDVTGQYITRYVSLRDGSVSYEPATPTFVRPTMAMGEGSVSIEV
jgi:hypothetical protein